MLAAAARTVSAQRQRGKALALAALLSHPRASVRAAAAQGLGVLGDPASAKALSERLAGDPDVEVRAEAARALGLVGGPFGISALTAAAGGDKDGRVRFLANESLRRLGFRR
ncbi:MAG: HEAT repeat domain-containing protein [Myxococcaceae bacterium]